MDNEVIPLGASLTIESVNALKKVLDEALILKKNIIFQAEEITQVDTAGLQFVLSFTKNLSQLNLEWEWQEPSMMLIHMANILGMSNLLKLGDFQGR